MIKRYAIFDIPKYDPLWWMHDYKISFNSEEEAKEYVANWDGWDNYVITDMDKYD